MDQQCYGRTSLDGNHKLKRKLLCLDDHQLVLDALSFVAGPLYQLRVVNSVSDFEAALAEFMPDLALLDIRLPDGDGFEVAARAVARYRSLKIMFLSMHTESRYVRRAAEIGAQGYLSKRAPAQELLTAIQAILNGGKYIGSRLNAETPDPEEARLTERQTEVLRLISQGYSAKEIANALNISVRTAEFHRAEIMERLKLHSTATMTRYAIERGIV
jgi:two-component system nitrate/nitrite response regulator NarL